MNRFVGFNYVMCFLFMRFCPNVPNHKEPKEIKGQILYQPFD